MNDLYVSLVVEHGDTKFKLRVSESEGYKDLGTQTLSLEQAKAVLAPLDNTVGTSLSSLAERVIRGNAKAKWDRIKELEATVAKLKAELA